MTTLAIVSVVLIAGIILWFRASQKRKKQLAGWARMRGLAFNPAKVTDLDSRFPRFDCLVRGTNRRAVNLAAGDWMERPILAFDYHHEIPAEDASGKQATRRRAFSAVVMGSKEFMEPVLIRPRKEEGDAEAMDFGLDVVTSDLKVFNQQFDFRARDPEWARQVIHPRTMELLLSCPRFNIQFDTSYVIAYGTAPFSVEDFSAAAHILERILEEMPTAATMKRRRERLMA